MKKHRNKIAVILFFLLFFTYSYVNGGKGSNQHSRLALLHSIFIHSSLHIDAYHTQTADKAQINGHYFSDKAPGTIIVALPGFLVAQIILKIMGYPFYVGADDPLVSWNIARWITTAVSAGLITALGGTALLLFLMDRLKPKIALLSVVFVFIGGMPFTYSVMLFSHSIVIALILIAFYLLAAPRNGSKKQNHWQGRLLVAGLCSGLAVASEYTSIFAVVLLVAFLLEKHPPKHWGYFSIGLLIGASVVPLYNLAAFNALHSVGYGHVVGFQGMKQGFFGIGLPNLDAASQLLFSPFRGLFFWCPFLLLSFFGIANLKKESKVLWIGIPALLIVQTLVISGYFYWYGGYALGPRHLAPVVPFLAIASAYAFSRMEITGLVLGSFSIFLTFLGTVVEPTPPKIKSLLFGYYVKEIANGRITDNLGLLLGIPGYYSLLPLCLIITLVVYWLLRLCRE